MFIILFYENHVIHELTYVENTIALKKINFKNIFFLKDFF